ncbi:NlpC/P60 family protein [Hyunsoonleella jejuensis]|uniref:NlpC/P60 family protein n=1 Tax=Hyunsoonleella jejuensis TaxID=419940 RepID=A0A1H9CRX7_9FLAO|nr:C40 family peptidase [Hyunsoonleella jejuensis]SEQ03909.1 NlpC/P60 family protein [Hyunsoonleella jejuensis]
MRRFLVLVSLMVMLVNCKSTKRQKVVTKKSKVEQRDITRTGKTTKANLKNGSTSSQIVNYSKQFLGTRYKWGGTTKKGMDCSGLVYESFKAHQVYLPRISRDMAKKGNKIPLKETLKGDLLFFKTGKNRRNSINHVGLVVEIKNNAIYFIHATTSKGVLISSLNEDYWKSAFAEVRRVL